jgi:hypothetical protein
MACEMHAKTLDLPPIAIPPDFHGSHFLQSCDDNDDRDILPADPRVKCGVVLDEGTKGSRAVHTVHQKADSIRPRVHELAQQVLQLVFCFRCHPRVETCGINQDKCLA